jgi:sodium/potassium-transporting ATPase subunit alpha
MAYGQIGMMQASAGFFTYLVIMAENGFKPDLLLGIRKRWDSRSVNDLEDSYGQEWVRRNQMSHWIFIFIGFINFIHPLNSFRRTMPASNSSTPATLPSSYRSLLCNGPICSFAKPDATHSSSKACAITSSPSVSFSRRPSPASFATRPAWTRVFACTRSSKDLFIRWVFLPEYLLKKTTLHECRINWWGPALPFSLLIFIYDEIRKFILRNNPGGWIERETYY